MIKAAGRPRRFGGTARQRNVITLSVTFATIFAVACCFGFATHRLAGFGGRVNALLGAEAAGPLSSFPFSFTAQRVKQVYSQPPAVHPVSGKPVRAKIVTCPACRLNSLPRVKKFVKEQSRWFMPGLQVEYIMGEDPHLHIYEGGKETSDIDLSDYDEGAIMRKLVKSGIFPNQLTLEIRDAVPSLRAKL